MRSTAIDCRRAGPCRRCPRLCRDRPRGAPDSLRRPFEPDPVRGSQSATLARGLRRGSA